MDRALAALHACADRLARRPLRAVRAIATEACRRAANGAEFLPGCAARPGSRSTSSRPARRPNSRWRAARRCCAAAAGGRCCSTSAAARPSSPGCGWPAMAGQAAASPSLIGYASACRSASSRWPSGSAPAAFTEPGFEAMVAEVAARLAAFERVHCIAHEIALGGVRLLGTSGTVTTLAGVALGLARYRRPLVDGAVLTREATDAALGLLRGLGRQGLMQHPCVGPRASRIRPARLRHLRGDPPDVAGAARDRRRSRPARGDAAADDAGTPFAPLRGRARRSPARLTRPARARAPRRRAGSTSRCAPHEGAAPPRSAGSQRQLNDPYVRAAHQQGWRSRAAFKLIETGRSLPADPPRRARARPRRGAGRLGAGGATARRRARGRHRPAADRAVAGAAVRAGRLRRPATCRAAARAARRRRPIWCCRTWRPTPPAMPRPTTSASWPWPSWRSIWRWRCWRRAAAFVAKVFQGGSERQMLEPHEAPLRRACVHAKPPASRKDVERALRGRDRVPLAPTRPRACDWRSAAAYVEPPRSEPRKVAMAPLSIETASDIGTAPSVAHRGGARLRRRAAGARLFAGPARGDRRPHPADPRHRAEHPADLGRDGHRHRERRWPSRWRSRAASA